MLNQYMEQIETFGTWFALAALFFLIGMAIQDVLKKVMCQNSAGFFVWLVLFLGCFGFIAKGIIQVIYESQGMG